MGEIKKDVRWCQETENNKVTEILHKRLLTKMCDDVDRNRKMLKFYMDASHKIIVLLGRMETRQNIWNYYKWPNDLR